MKFGVNLLLFGDRITPALLRRFALIRELGFDGVEVPIFDPASVDIDRIRAAAGRNGLELTVSGALPPGTRFYGREAAPRRAAERYVRALVRATAALGAPVACGPLYKAVGDVDLSMPLDAQRRETARAMRPLAQEAEAAGVTFAFEPLNRFETNFLNTAEQGIAFCAALKSPAAGLLLDTFHMHIEEKDTAAAIRAAARAGVLAHVHTAENDRGPAGSGQVHWDAVGAALRAARYNRWVMLETFNQDNQAIKTAVSCWKPFYTSEREFMTMGLAHVRKLLGAARRGKGSRV